jgi:hypothetical protein
MRIVSFVLLAACSGPGAVSVDPMNSLPIGVGLVERFQVSQDYCDEGIDSDCESIPPMSLSVDTDSDTVKVINVTPSSASFDLVGIKAGSASVDVTGDDGGDDVLVVTVANVASTTLFVPRQVTSQLGFAEVMSPVSAFTHSSISIAQTSVGTDGQALAGEAVLEVMRNGSSATLDGDTLETGSDTGSAQVSTNLATMTVNVVEDAALADFTIGDSPSTDVTIMQTGDPTDLWLLAADASGRPIVGLGGPKPTFQITDPSVVAGVGLGSSGVVPSVVVRPVATGDTTMTITWGAVTKTFALHVLPLS